VVVSVLTCALGHVALNDITFYLTTKSLQFSCQWCHSPISHRNFARYTLQGAQLGSQI
jgi:pyruvate-formate lyase-activating enzyme